LAVIAGITKGFGGDVLGDGEVMVRVDSSVNFYFSLFNKSSFIFFDEPLKIN
jgi:hypothetical protein